MSELHRQQLEQSEQASQTHHTMGFILKRVQQPQQPAQVAEGTITGTVKELLDFEMMVNKALPQYRLHISDLHGKAKPGAQ
jgi:hypothetical protein